MSDSQARHLHPLYFVVLLAAWIQPLIVPILVFVVFQGKGNPFDWPPIAYYCILAAIALQFVGTLLAWRRYTYTRDSQQLVVSSGILFRQIKTIHRNRVHSIQIQQPLLQRLFGIAQVVIETAGGGGKPEVVLRAVSLKEAHHIQELARKAEIDEVIIKSSYQEEAIEEDGVEEDSYSTQHERQRQVLVETSGLYKEPVEAVYEISVSTSTFLLAAVTTSNLQLTMAFIAGIVSFADDILGESIYDSVADTAVRYLNGPFSVLIWASAALVLSWLLSVGLYVWKYANFKLAVQGEQITISYGLLEKRQLTFPAAKVQAAMFVEGLLRKPLRLGELRLLVVHSEKEAAVMLHPLLKGSEVVELLARFVPHIRPIIPDIMPQGKAWLAFVRWKLVMTTLFTIGLIYGFGWELAWPSLLLIPLALLWGHSQYRSEAAGMSGNDFALRHRRLAVTTAWMRKKHIQTLTLKASILQRRKGMRNVEAAVMGGMKGYSFSARLLPDRQAELIKQWVSREKKSLEL